MSGRLAASPPIRKANVSLRIEEWPVPETLINLHTLYEKMGEVGQIARDAKHAANNTSAKVDALAVVVATQGHLRDDVERLHAEIANAKEDIEILTIDKHRREGAIGLVEWCSKHWPFLGLSGVILTFVAYANGLLGK
jgi:hypothetical protein